LADESKAQKEKKKTEGEDFKYIVRIANTDIDGEKVAITALTGVKGVGTRIADIALKRIGYPTTKKLGHISDEDVARLEKVLLELPETTAEWLLNRQKDWESGDDLHLLSTELEMGLRDDINRMRMIRCYRGIRHETGHKVRGQRTRSNGRTGLTLGVSRKKGVQGPAA
jgi:small subunit ribosomal protein S13